MTQPLPSASPGSPPIPDAAIGYQGAVFVDRDQEHMKILSVCWYVLSALAVLMGCVPIIHVTIGLVLILSPATFGNGPSGPPPAFLGWMFFLMGSVFMLLGWTGAVLAFLTARSLKQRRRLMLCYVTAALACVQVPIGTCLGVFTFIVLGRPSVRASFV